MSSAGQAQAALSLLRLGGRDTLGPNAGALGRVNGLDWSLGPGLHAVVGAPADGTAALAGLLAGEYPPESGEVRLRGARPFDDATCRARIGALLPKTRLFGRTVSDVVSLARAANGGADPLSPLGLEALAARTVSSLSVGEARALELALALSHPEPWLLVFYEPWSLVAGVETAALREALLRRATDTPIALLVSAPSDVATLAETVHLLDAGRWAAADGGRGWCARAARNLVLVLDDRDGVAARGMAQALSDHVLDARAISWSRLDDDPMASVVTVAANDLEAAAIVLVRLCAERAVTVRSISTPLIERDTLLAMVRSPHAEVRG